MSPYELTGSLMSITLVLHRLHEAGWVHRDFSPGNVIVVEGKARISDLEFAERRVADDLEELTRPGNASSAAKKNVCTVGSFGELYELG